MYDAEAFIAALTQHIPDKLFQMVRYYGFYSNKKEIPITYHYHFY
ncbi:MAG: hypothetical protein HOD92_09800 [Deltaproteobacteria bacterium]|nr:hypothetical protein [Deltaproteobacteria bacterium]MBT4526649.1 hypothetical protein [Deltaproteobacteria bacterium]